MEWMATLGGFWLTTLAWLAGLALVFGLLARLMPCNPGMYWWQDLRAVAADLMYWLIVPLLSRLVRTLLLVAGVVLLFGGREPHLLPVQELSLWQQGLAILLLQDVLMYWVHRAFHTRRAWKFHAVHHSPKVLDWTSAVRFHPVNSLLEFALADVVVLLLGFSPRALLILAPFNVVYSALVHANLSWTFGPLRHVFASPVFHRWHHTTQREGQDKNFAPTFPLLDVIFGTFYMPPGRLPEQFGTGEPDFPQGFWGQLLYPFRERGPALPGTRRRRAAIVAVVSGLAVVGLVAGELYFQARLVRLNEQRAAALRAQLRQPPAEAVSLDPAPRAWAGNNRVRSSAVTAVTMSADGRRIVTGDEGGTVKVWDAGAGREEISITAHRGRVTGVALSGDGRCVVSGGFDRMVKVWDGATGQEVLTLSGHRGAVLSVAISADGGRVVSGGSDGTVKVWDGTAGRELLTLTGDTDAFPSVAVSADGRRVVGADFATAKVWDAATGRQEQDLKGHGDLIFSVAISPDGRRAVTGSFDGTAKVWDAEAGREEITLKGHGDSVYSVAISPDGKRVVSGGNDGTIKVWDAEAGRQECVLTGHADAVTGVAVSADGGRIVSASRDGAMRVWDAPGAAGGGAACSDGMH